MENKYFQEALSALVSNVAYGDTVRRLYDAGCSVDEIKRMLDYPVSEEKIEKVIRDYEYKKSKDNADFEYVQRTDQYGCRSFIKVVKKGENNEDCKNNNNR